MSGDAFTQVRIEGIPVLDGHTRASGEPLDDGLVVPSGAVLLGEPLKAAHPLSNVRRWQGSFVLIGPVPEAVQDLRAQLDRAGYRISSSCDRFDADDPDGPGFAAVVCTLRAVKDQPVGDRRSVHARAARWQPAPGRPAGSYLFMELTAERRGTTTPRDWESTLVESEGPLHDAPRPEAWPDLPGERDQLFPDLGAATPPEVRAWRVPPGTSPVGPMVGARVVLVQSRGRVARSFDDLVDQARAAIGPTASVIRAPDAKEDGVRVRFATVGERGDGRTTHITAIEQRGHPSYLTLETSSARV